MAMSDIHQLGPCIECACACVNNYMYSYASADSAERP